MREAELSTGERNADLAVVHVAGEHEIERVRPDAIDRRREVREQDARNPRPGRGQAHGRAMRGSRPASQTRAPRTSIIRAFVEEERRRIERLQLDRFRERVASRCDIVVSQDRVAVWQSGEQPPELCLAARPRYEVARDAHEVRLAPVRPRDRAPDGPCAPGRKSEVEVRQVRDPKSVERYWQSRHFDVEDAQPHPARLEPTPDEARRRKGGQADADREHLPFLGASAGSPRRSRASPGASRGRRGAVGQTESFSVTGVTETTWRLNFSSESVEPGRDADQLGEVEDRHVEVRPVAFSSFGCHASSERWQSGHGVTIASAPASIACSIGWISSPSATSSRAWMIGKPQHLIFAG